MIFVAPKQYIFRQKRCNVIHITASGLLLFCIILIKRQIYNRNAVWETCGYKAAQRKYCPLTICGSFLRWNNTIHRSMTSTAHMLTQRKRLGMFHYLFILTWCLPSLVRQNGLPGDLWGPICKLLLNVYRENNSHRFLQMPGNVATVNHIIV